MIVKSLMVCVSLSFVVAGFSGCDPAAEGEGEEGDGEGESDEAETPPEGHDAVEEWIAAGFYKDWTCEPAPHDARDPSPHGRNRICSNALMSGAPTTGAFPVGSAAVKELLDDADAIIGYAVYRKAEADPTSADGSNWYWYERVAPGTVLQTPDPVLANGVVADSRGSAGGNALAVCIDCHSHAPNDFAFTQVR